ncbi:pentapeptide repeat-containing protein [Streptomyces sp. NPDC014995]|uniref:pentapeptide repeat-containing protein n=1 Tax=Streptomyces sp. NPDC014995 TaxID=3364936 RepID=UPI003700EF68
MIIFAWLSLQQVDNEQALIRNEHALTREGQVTDRYNNAVSNIGDDSEEVRLGGIYALQRIMEDSPRDQPSIVNALSTYVRNHAKRPIKGAPALKLLASDVQAALTALGRRDPIHDGAAPIDLVNTSLFSADLRCTHLGGADLGDAHLGGADLHSADLRRTKLVNADLEDADLSSADLLRADLGGADLHGANLREANLHGANLREANLHGANLREANLRGADLREADLYGADLRGAKR